MLIKLLGLAYLAKKCWVFVRSQVVTLWAASELFLVWVVDGRRRRLWVDLAG